LETGSKEIIGFWGAFLAIILGMKLLVLLLFTVPAFAAPSFPEQCQTVASADQARFCSGVDNSYALGCVKKLPAMVVYCGLLSTAEGLSCVTSLTKLTGFTITNEMVGACANVKNKFSLQCVASLKNPGAFQINACAYSATNAKSLACVKKKTEPDMNQIEACGTGASGASVMGDISPAGQ
jgi:hypothetical protein